MKKERLMGIALVAGLAALLALGLWRASRERGGLRVLIERRPQGVMGTTCRLAVVAAPGQGLAADEILKMAENELRAAEARMSVWLEGTEISRLNAAGPGTEIPLSPETLAVLKAAREAAAATDGAFDATCRPLIELWKDAGRTGKLPDRRRLDQARAASHWDLIELTESGAVKHGPGVQVDLGGLAKGYAIDRAAAVLRRSGFPGGMADVGGDLFCFGRPADGEYWEIGIRDPFGGGMAGTVKVRDQAVCTSGNYARYVEIEGKRYSHILDPRAGRPADSVPSATVVAPNALQADIWATALSVLGPGGLEHLPPSTEALLILGDAAAPRYLCTPGLLPFLGAALKKEIKTFGQNK